MGENESVLMLAPENVLVVEYGYIDNSNTTLWPYYAQGLTINAADAFQGLVSVPQSELGNKTFPLQVGSVVGGGSIINGMAFDRGTQPDYDSWNELGNEGWGWNGLLPYFKKVNYPLLGASIVQKMLVAIAGNQYVRAF